MAEIIGVVASAVTLFDMCMKGFDFVDTIKQYEDDVHRLTLKLVIEKCRLYAWGQSMGLMESSRDGARNTLEDCQFAITVKETLRLIVQILDSSQKTRERYGCQRVLEPSTFASSSELKRTSVVLELNASFRSDGVAGKQDYLGSKQIAKTWWAIRDRSKFEKLIKDAKELIDGLQEITKDDISRSKQDKIVTEHMTRSDDIPSLQTIAAICRDSYPSVSDAASFRVGRLSLRDSNYGGVEEWVRGIENGFNDAVNMMVTEKLGSTTAMPLEQKRRLPQHQLSVLQAEFLAKTEKYSKMLQQVQSQPIDKELFEEVDAVGQWFRVLPMEERMFTFYAQAQALNREECRLVSAIFKAAENGAQSSQTSSDILLGQLTHKEQLKLGMIEFDDQSSYTQAKHRLPPTVNLDEVGFI